MSVSFPEPIQSNQPTADRFAFDKDIRKRLNSIDQVGQGQNQYVMEQANNRMDAEAQQRQQLLQQRAAMAAQGQANVIPAAAPTQTQGQQGPTTGNYSNQANANNPNPKNPQQAIEFAKAAIARGDTNWYRRCLAFVSQAYGLPASGTNYAIDAYTRLGANQRHDGDRNPSVGSLLYYNTNNRAGHVALYAGNGMAYSNDISGAGKIGYVPVSDFENKWGARYAGWADPYFASSPNR